MPYSAVVLNHFRHPRHAGELPHSSAVAEASNPVCGDVIKLWLRVENGRVMSASFKAAGCVPSIACGSWLADWLSAGRTVSEALALTSQNVEAALDEVPAASKHAADLAVDVLRKALAKAVY
jgi:nitrogen fixation protein NifU and related proteins